MDYKEKSFLELAGKPLLARAIDRLGPQCSRLIINANGGHDRFSQFGLPVQADTVEGFRGPLAGVLAAMRWTEANSPAATHVLTAATDTPFFPLTLGRQLSKAMAAASAKIAIAASGERIQPVFGLWPVELADDLEDYLVFEEMGKVMLFVQRYPHSRVEFRAGEREMPGFDPFFNINAPNDLAKANDILAGV